MKKLFLPLCASLALSLAFTSCKKDSDKDPAPSATDKATYLTQSGRKWKITAHTSQQAGSSVISNDFDDMLPCELDNYYVFQSNGTMIGNEGTQKCDSSDPATVNGSWALMNNATQMTFSSPMFGSDAALVDVIDLTSSVLRFRAVEPGTSSDPAVTHTVTLSAF